MSHSPVPFSQRKPGSLVTYRFSDKMVYVTVAPTYEVRVDAWCSMERPLTIIRLLQEAIQYALREFPELARYGADRIALWTHAKVAKQPQRVRVGSMAWEQVIQNLAQYEIIEISVEPPRPRIVISDDPAAPPPVYTEGEESYDRLDAKSRSPSASRSGSPSSTSSKQSASRLKRFMGGLQEAGRALKPE